jgi:acetyltransferase
MTLFILMLDTIIDPSQDYLEERHHPLHSFFEPKSVAIIGAKEEPKSVGRTLLANMMASFQGKIYPVNPKYPKVLGLPTFAQVQDIPEAVDLAVIVTPARLVPDLIDDCARAKVPAAIIISAGFKEVGKAGLELEQEVVRRARAGGVRLIGPNCLGVMNPHIGLNATFAAGMALKGNMAFISQSGALCCSVLDWSLQENIGFSAFVSIGSMADVAWGDLIDYLDRDPNTKSILIYMETVGDARSFLSAAREVVFHKPVILIKPGRTAAAAKAAASHTGSLAGADDVFDTAIQRVGVLRVDTIAELFNMAEVIAKQPRLKGPRLAIITNAGGPAVLATDQTLLYGAKLAELTPESMEKLSSFLPSAWSHNNPVDILGDADAQRYHQTLEVVAQDPNVDGMLVILTPQDMTESTATAKLLEPRDKPVLASWMGGGHVADGVKILKERGISTFLYPDSACRAFGALWSQSDLLKLLYETPSVREEPWEQEKKLDLPKNRTLLTEAESKQILQAYGIPVVETIIAPSIAEAIRAADKIGYPVVVKLHSLEITHKTDVGGVKLNLKDRHAVENAFVEIAKKVPKDQFQGVTVQKMVQLSGYELILGSLVDPQFGPVILFGAGGELVEVFKDRALALPPLNTTLAKRMMQKTKIYTALQGVRGKKGIDLIKLEEIVIRFSRLIMEQPRIKECDINPLIATPDTLLALDARIVLHGPALTDNQLPKPAIRPYPIQYVKGHTLRNGAAVTLRPARPEDEPLIAAFHRELSEESVRQRYFGFISLEKRIAHDRLIKICHTDYDREILLLAEVSKAVIGACRISKIYGTEEAEIKLIIVDKWHHQGLGKLLLEQAVLIAHQENIKKLSCLILQENTVMLKLCEKLGFKLEKTKKEASIIQATLDLFRN